MQKKKIYISDEEQSLLIHAINDLRNKRIAEGKGVSVVEDTLLAVINAKTKRIKIKEGYPS